MHRDCEETLAIDGGVPAIQTPVPQRKRHGEAEKRYLNEVIDSDMLFFFSGTKVRELEKRFAALYQKEHCLACSSGTAAVHLALASLQMRPGTEVIVPAITDMGSLTGVLYQGLVPVFADVEPGTLNIDPRSVRATITPRTGALLVVHHSGLAADLDALFAVASESGIPVIEDCAQAYGCEYHNELVGRRGVMSCFSLNHFKHISTGSGGMILTDDDRLRYLASLYLDKCYQREEGVRNPYFLAPNYQLTELQGAVGLAQLEKLPDFLERRRRAAGRVASRLSAVRGIELQCVDAGSVHSYFLFLFKIDPQYFGCTSETFAAALRAEGVNAKANVITGGRPVYLYDIFQKRQAFPDSTYPFTSSDTGANRFYERGLCPVAESAFPCWINIEILENYTEQNGEEIGMAVDKVARHFARCKTPYGT